MQSAKERVRHCHSRAMKFVVHHSHKCVGEDCCRREWTSDLSGDTTVKSHPCASESVPYSRTIDKAGRRHGPEIIPVISLKQCASLLLSRHRRSG